MCERCLLNFQDIFGRLARKNKVLRMGCLGTQGPHSVCASSGPIDPQSQETMFDQTLGASALLSQQCDCSNIGTPEVHFLRDESSAAMTYIHPLSSRDYGSMAPTPAPCSSGLETVFSPNLKQIDPPESNVTDHSATDANTEFLQLVLNDNDEEYISSEFQVWDVDLYFPESFSTVQFNSLMGFTNDDSTSYHECVDAVAMAQRSISSPILDETREADAASCGLPVDYATFYIQNKPSDSDNECSSASCNVLGCEFSDNEVLSAGLPQLIDIGSPCNSNHLPGPSAETKNIVLVLDLDETLVHSKLDPCDNFDFTLKIFFNMGDHTVYVRKRPHLEMFLEQVAQMFEVVIFTASERVYAEPLLDKLDPDRKLISCCLYRESCTFSGGSYTKDLTIFGVDLAKIAIIDNTPQVFQLQVDNGIPIKSWFDDPTDLELVEILAFLPTLVDAEDVRPIISKAFNKPQ